mgnify:CR=1 FL=1
MFLLTFLVVNMAPTRRELDNDLFTVSGIVQKYNCTLKRLDFQQEQGLISSLALGLNQVEIERGLPQAAPPFLCLSPPVSCSRRGRRFIMA